MVCRILALVLVAIIGTAVRSAEPVPAAKPIRTMLHAGWITTPPTEEYLRFVEQVKPDILIVGVFDQQLYATAARADPKAKPLPPPGESLAQWKALADRLHKNGIRLVGHMKLNVLSDRPTDLAQGIGWFGYYEKHWDDKLLGRRPTKTAAELLEEPDLDRHAHVPKGDAKDTIARCGCRVNLRALNACINKPAWRTIQKAMVKVAIEHGVDGFITNRNYVNHCACADCTRKFRQWLADQHSPEQLHERFGILDLNKQPLCMVGAHRDHDTVPPLLMLEKLRFAKAMVKEFFDEVYTAYGRSRKPDLIVAQWNHWAYFDELHLDRSHLPPSTRTGFAHAAADERWGLPIERWGKGESLLWYCNWGTTQHTILEKEYAGDTVLYGKLLRTMARGTPYVINKYDFYRPRNMMAEAAALGYATNAIATPWQHEEDRAVVLRYFDFLKKHEELYRSAESYAEVALIFPRRALHAGDASALEYVEAAGRTLVREHILFDMVPDDMLEQVRLNGYRAVVLAAPEYLEEKERKVLTEYVGKGGKLFLTPVSKEDRERPGVASEEARRRAGTASFPLTATRVDNIRLDRVAFLKALETAVGGHLSRFATPWTVQVHAYRQPGPRRLVLHFVNYNHQEKATGKSVAAREAPVAAEPVKVRLQLPAGFQVKALSFQSPDEDKTSAPAFSQKDGLLEFQTPSFLVYGLCVVQE